MEMGEEPLVKTVAHMFKQLCYDYRDQLTAGIIVAGWDKVNGGQVSHPPTYSFSFLHYNSSVHMRGLS